METNSTINVNLLKKYFPSDIIGFPLSSMRFTQQKYVSMFTPSVRVFVKTSLDYRSRPIYKELGVISHASYLLIVSMKSLQEVNAISPIEFDYLGSDYTLRARFTYDSESL